MHWVLQRTQGDSGFPGVCLRLLSCRIQGNISPKWCLECSAAYKLKMPAAPNPWPAETCSSVPPPASHPALALTAQLSQHQWHCTLMWAMSPFFNTKTHIMFIIREFGLALPRPGPALLSCLPCKPGISCQGGKNNPEVAGDSRGGGGKVLGSDGKTRVWDLGKGTG